VLAWAVVLVVAPLVLVVAPLVEVAWVVGWEGGWRLGVAWVPAWALVLEPACSTGNEAGACQQAAAQEVYLMLFAGPTISGRMCVIGGNHCYSCNLLYKPSTTGTEQDLQHSLDQTWACARMLVLALVSCHAALTGVGAGVGSGAGVGGGGGTGAGVMAGGGTTGGATCGHMAEHVTP
jgi:hypothetical protein